MEKLDVAKSIRLSAHLQIWSTIAAGIPSIKQTSPWRYLLPRSCLCSHESGLLKEWSSSDGESNASTNNFLSKKRESLVWQRKKPKYVKGFDGTRPVLQQSPAVLQILLQNTQAHRLQHHSFWKANIQLQCPCWRSSSDLQHFLLEQKRWTQREMCMHGSV